MDDFFDKILSLPTEVVSVCPFLDSISKGEQQVIENTHYTQYLHGSSSFDHKKECPRLLLEGQEEKYSNGREENIEGSSLSVITEDPSAIYTAEKKREQSRMSEKNRRKRIKDRFDELRRLIGNPELKQEELIGEAISRLKELEGHKKQKRENSGQCVIQHRTLLLSSIAPQEITYVFPHAEEQILRKINANDANITPNDVWVDCLQLYNLGKKSKNPKFILRSLLCMQIFHKELLGDVIGANRSVEDARPIYEKMSLEEKKGFIFNGKNLGAAVLIYSATLAAAGRYSEADVALVEGLELVKDHPPSKNFGEMVKMRHAYLRYEDLLENH